MFTRQACNNDSKQIPNQLLIFEVNGKFVHECLPIQPEEIRTFKAINRENRQDIGRQRLSYFSGIVKW